VLRICEKLNQIGVTVRPDDVFQLAGAGNLSRLHVAQALVRAGRARSIGSAFKRWLGPRGAAYIPRERPPVAETILLIHRAGGVAVMAHPGQTARDEEIPRMAEAGLDGIEVYCPDHSPSQERHYLGLARQHRLLPGGGSDCHGHGKDNLTLGKVRVDDVDVDALRNRATSRS
jgi:predicted metal-dependent phosphoesterase TrpH